MDRQRLKLLFACGALTVAACSAEMDSNTTAALTRSSERGDRAARANSSGDSPVDDAKDAVSESTGPITGAAGSGPEPMVPARSTNRVIYGLDGEPLTGKVRLSPGSTISGTVELYCCRAGAYSVYTYEGGRCSDPQTWRVEHSARIADVQCANDLGEAPYVRDPAPTTTFAFVIYDDVGTAVGCADVSSAGG